MENTPRTLGDVVRGHCSETIEKTLGWIYNHRRGVGLAATATALYALYQGWNNPADFSDLSNPNFVKPGEDTQWHILMNVLGMINSAARYYASHIHYNLAAIVGGGILDAGVKRVSSIQISPKK